MSESLAAKQLAVTRLYVAALKAVPGSPRQAEIKAEIERLEAEIEAEEQS